MKVWRGPGTNFRNTGVGRDALLLNNFGESNTAIGHEAGSRNTNGNDITAVGARALWANSTGSENTAIGADALLLNFTGSFNTAVGHRAGAQINSPANTAIGNYALTNCTTGSSNTAVGSGALQYLTTGYQNVRVGTSDGNITTGFNNIMIGHNAQASGTTVNNTATIGNSAITVLRCNVTSITALSDARDKKNIANIPAGLDFVQALRPVAFDWSMRDGGKVDVHEFGFIAQELQAAQAATGVTVPGLVYDVNPDKLEACAGTLIPILVKAIQELKATVDAQASRISDLESGAE
jgi:hypothetical protein